MYYCLFSIKKVFRFSLQFYGSGKNSFRKTLRCTGADIACIDGDGSGHGAYSACFVYISQVAGRKVEDDRFALARLQYHFLKTDQLAKGASGAIALCDR